MSLLCDNCGITAVDVFETRERFKVWRCKSCGNTKAWCPACDQGWIHAHLLTDNGLVVLKCDECDATWMSVSDINKSEPLNFSVFCRRGGLNLPVGAKKLDIFNW